MPGAYLRASPGEAVRGPEPAGGGFFVSWRRFCLEGAAERWLCRGCSARTLWKRASVSVNYFGLSTRTNPGGSTNLSVASSAEASPVSFSGFCHHKLTEVKRRGFLQQFDVE